MKMIELEKVSKVYGRDEGCVTALRDVDLRVERGEYVALTGPSGSGKSTLMHILGCLDRPTSGTYLLAGQDVSRMSVDELAAIRNRRVGFVFQSFHLLARADAIDNVALPLRFAGMPLEKRRDHARALLQRLGLGERLGHRPSELSGGQQQRVAIARALVNDPDLLLADEPTGNLDSAASSDIVGLLEQMCDEGRTLVVVTHDAALAERAPRILRLCDGALVEGAS